MPPVGAIDEPLAGIRKPADAVEGCVALVVHNFNVPYELQVSGLSSSMERGVVAQLVYLSHNLVGKETNLRQ